MKIDLTQKYSLVLGNVAQKKTDLGKITSCSFTTCEAIVAGIFRGIEKVTIAEQ